jgi:hypothetical protein
MVPCGLNTNLCLRCVYCMHQTQLKSTACFDLCGVGVCRCELCPFRFRLWPCLHGFRFRLWPCLISNRHPARPGACPFSASTTDRTDAPGSGSITALFARVVTTNAEAHCRGPTNAANCLTILSCLGLGYSWCRLLTGALYH